MKILIALIFWLLCSIVLACSVVGLLLFIRTDFVSGYYTTDGRSSWMKIGIELANKLTEEK